jgi:hypothetical protein
MKSVTSFSRLVFALLNQQNPKDLLAASVVVPLTGFFGLTLIKLANVIMPLLLWLLLAWGLLLLSMALVKFAQRFLWRFTR